MISISFVVVLLATYCYSIPIEPRPPHVTPEYEFTTGRTIIDHTDKINMHLVSSEEAGRLPNIHKERSVMMDDKDELTTSYPYHQRSLMPDSKEAFTTSYPSEHHDHMVRTMDNPVYSTSTARSTFASPSSDEIGVHNNLNKYFLTTMESSTQFHARAIKPEDQSDESKRSEPTEDRSAESKRSESKEDRSTESKRSKPTEDPTAESKRSEPEDRPTEIKRSESKEDKSAESKRSESKEDKSAETKRSESKEEKSAESKRSESKEDKSAESKRSQPSDVPDGPAGPPLIQSKRSESKEDKSAESKRAQPEDDVKTTTEYSQDFTSTTRRNRNVAESRENSKENPSSADSFSRMTGLLKDQTEETPKKPVDHSMEESTTRSSDKMPSVKSTTRSSGKMSSEESTTPSSDKMSSEESTTRRAVHKITETEIVFPIEIIETKVYGQKQPVVKTPKSDN